MTKARDISKLLSTANGKIAGENLDVSFENITDTGTEGTRVATGTTAQRGSTAGQFRFNSTSGKFEGYDGSAFKEIDTPPTVISIDTTEIASASGTTTDIVITGTNFQSGATVKAIGTDASEILAGTVVVNSVTQITATFTDSNFSNANEPYDIQVSNSNGLSGTLSDQINVDNAPTWTTASGTLGTFDNYDTVNVSVSATDPEGDTIVYSVQTGSLPTGLSLNSSTGAITGTVSGATSSTTYSFTLRATAGSKTSDRAFTFTINPVIEQFTSSGTWTVPSGVSQIAILVVAGGGSGGTTDNSSQSNRGGAGGAGGVILIPNWNVSGASSYSVNIGSGGQVVSGGVNNGGNTTFSGGSKTLTALGGGAGGFSDNTDNGQSGGSGGSSWYTISGAPANSGTQPANTSDGVTTYNGTGYGNASGSASNVQPYSGGGGGAGGAGVNANDAYSGTTTTDSQGNSLSSDQGNAVGGVGLYIGSIFGTSYGEQGFVASGGTGAGYSGAVADFNSVSTKAHLGGGGIGYNASTSTPSNAQANGQANTGGGGGSGGNGGSGLVLIKY